MYLFNTRYWYSVWRFMRLFPFVTLPRIPTEKKEWNKLKERSIFLLFPTFFLRAKQPSKWRGQPRIDVMTSLLVIWGLLAAPVVWRTADTNKRFFNYRNASRGTWTSLNKRLRNGTTEQLMPWDKEHNSSFLCVRKVHARFIHVESILQNVLIRVNIV